MIDDNEMTTLVSKHNPVTVYRNPVLATIWEVLYCLLEVGGRREGDGAGDGVGRRARLKQVIQPGRGSSACRDTC